ncbi:putative transcription factor B3-Domain family [Helianthus annuus]|nr:putative transcription factor B3-Domain family [Helianthus annuus]
MDLDNFLILKNKFHVDPKGKTNVIVCLCSVDPRGKPNVFASDRSLSSIVVSDAMPKSTGDVGQFVAMRKSKAVMLVSDESHIVHRTRSKFTKKNESVVVDSMTPAETISVRSITHTSDVVSCKRSTLKRSKTVSFIEFTKVAENRMHLPSDVAHELALSVDSLHDITIQNLRSELTNMNTIVEKNGDGYRYGFSKWSAFLKSNHIQFGATLFFKYVKSSQLLMLTKVVHKTTKKRGLVCVVST